ncbi:MAG TPA: SRPBCC family protein [Caulobacteraceae bacterium]
MRAIEIKAPPRAVWRWLASEEALRAWLSPSLTIDLQVGGAYRFQGPDGETCISGVVLELFSEAALILSWMEEGSDWVHPARLVITLTPIGGCTRVELGHDGFAGIGKAAWRSTWEAYERGADRHKVLEALASVVAVDA